VSTNITWQPGRLHRKERHECVGNGATLWMTGLSGSGKSTIASMVESELIRKGRAAYMLDGDNLRHGVNADLGFDAAARSENVRRAAHVAVLFADAGVVAVVSLISPYGTDRDAARELHALAELPFLEIFVDTPLDVCEQRDPKGLYARARKGEIPGFTGVGDPYEPPENPDVHIQTQSDSVEQAVARVLAKLDEALTGAAPGRSR